MKRKVGTSLMIRSNVGLSRTTACCALSLTLPLDHFFFLAALPPLDDVGAALALACKQRELGQRAPTSSGPRGRHPSAGSTQTAPKLL